MKCPICGKNTSDTVKFCGQCGQKIPRCPTCGEVIYKRTSFCIHDGTPLPEDVLALLPTEAAPAVPAGAGSAEDSVAAAISQAFDDTSRSEESAQTQEPPATEPAVSQTPHQRSFCIKCGRPIYDGQRLCPDCSRPQRFCIRCGRPVLDGQEICSLCQRTVPEPKEERHTLRLVLIIIIIVLLLAVGGVFAYAYVNDMIPFLPRTAASDQLENPEEPETSDSDLSDSDLSDSDQPKESDVGPSDTEEPEETEPGLSHSDNPEGSESDSSDSESDSSDSESDSEIELSDPVMALILTSDSVYFTRADLEGFDTDMCRLLRNGIYARHGRKFKDETLQAYFDACDWYTGTVEPDDFSDSVLNDYEVANLAFVVNYEKEMGYRD